MLISENIQNDAISSEENFIESTCFSKIKNHIRCNEDKAFAAETEATSSDRTRLNDGKKYDLLSQKEQNSIPRKDFWKYVIFVLIWLLSAWHLLTVKEKVLIKHEILISDNISRTLNVSYQEYGSKISVNIVGPFHECTNATEHYVMIEENHSKHRHVFVIDQSNDEINTLNFDIRPEGNGTLNLSFSLTSNVRESIAFQFFVDSYSVETEIGVISAGIILVFLNILIGTEILHRTIAAMFTAFTSIGILAALQDRPTMGDIVSWINCETLLLIFSMMVIVAILAEVGFFECIAIYAYQMSRGRIWSLITILCIISAIVSMVLDNETTVLLMTPIVIKLFECLNLNPVPVLPFIILNINIAGLATLIGHPPNLLITENTYVAQHQVTFVTYAMHMSIGVVLALVQTNIHLRIQCRNIHKLLGRKVDSNSEMHIWRKCLNDIEASGKCDELQDVRSLLMERIKSFDLDKPKTADRINFKIIPISLEHLKKTHPIKDKQLLTKAGAILLFVILLFFVETIPSIQRLSLGWCAFMGMILLIVITNCQLDSVLQKVEWVTLLFFGAMFVTMECLARLGLIKWIGKQTEDVILLVDERMRLAFAIIIILWFSALSSSVIDSTPVTAMMVKVLDSFAKNASLNLPIKPIVFALAFGPTLGANGSLYGASSNILCAGVAEKLGYKITCSQYFKIGFPVMIGNVLLVTIYLLTAHVLFQWH